MARILPDPPEPTDHPQAIKGRGAASKREGRFEATRAEGVDDGWERVEDAPTRPATTVT